MWRHTVFSFEEENEPLRKVWNRQHLTRRMFKDLPLEYDVIVVGTGMVESILAAACARIGKSVFHIDTNDYYGSEWTSFALNGLTEWTEMQKNPVIGEIEPKDEHEQILKISDPSNVFRNVQFKWNIEETKTENEEEKKESALEKLKKQSRRFNIDLAPKLYYATGGIIDLLVQSNIGKYCEFKLVSRLLFERNGQLDLVPSSRADIFNSNNISLIDKRLLMKVIMNCASMSVEDLKEDQDLPFIEYLKKQKLNENLCHLIINSISMVDYNATTKEGVTKAKRYLESIGKYGNTPFLAQLYSCGELTQCFCRLSAVFGGIYYLRFPLAGLTIDPSTKECRGVVATSGERFTAKDAVICNSAFTESNETNPKVIHRVVLITDRSIKTSEKEEITYLRLSGPDEAGIHVIEVGYGVGCTAEGFFLVYIFQEKPADSQSDSTERMIERLLKLTGENFTRANILGQLSFDQVQAESTSTSSSISKLFYTHGPDGSIDHDSAVNTARNLFQQIYSNGEQFLERAPDSEDIIFEDNTNTDETSTPVTDTETATSTADAESEKTDSL